MMFHDVSVMIFSDENCTIFNIMQWCIYRLREEKTFCTNFIHFGIGWFLLSPHYCALEDENFVVGHCARWQKQFCKPLFNGYVPQSFVIEWNVGQTSLHFAKPCLIFVKTFEFHWSTSTFDSYFQAGQRTRHILFLNYLLWLLFLCAKRLQYSFFHSFFDCKIFRRQRVMNLNTRKICLPQKVIYESVMFFYLTHFLFNKKQRREKLSSIKINWAQLKCKFTFWISDDDGDEWRANVEIVRKLNYELKF